MPDPSKSPVPAMPAIAGTPQFILSRLDYYMAAIIAAVVQRKDVKINAGGFVDAKRTALMAIAEVDKV